MKTYVNKSLKIESRVETQIDKFWIVKTLNSAM